MFKRPSTRRKSKGDEMSLNLVPMLDALVTLITFLIYSMSFLAIVSIDSPIPIANGSINETASKKPPLQLTVTIRDGETEIWSPFDRIRARRIPHTAEGSPDVPGIHARLIEIKQDFKDETAAVLVPHGGISYDILVAVMDAVRNLDAGDPPIYMKDAQTGMDIEAKQLFPDIVFGNILGDLEG